MPLFLSRLRGLVAPTALDEPLRLADAPGINPTGFGGGGGRGPRGRPGSDARPRRIFLGGGAAGSSSLAISDGVNNISAVTTEIFNGATVGVPSADPFFANVSLLIPYTSAPFVDLSHNGLGLTATGTITADASTFQFGPASGNFAPSGSRAMQQSIAITSGSPLDLSTGDLTIEAWIKVTPTSGIGAVMCAYGSSLAVEIFCAVNSLNISSTSFGKTLGGTLTSGWNHLALCIQGTTLFWWINGVAATTSGTLSRPSLVGQVLYIGGTNFGASLVGWMQDFRITKGVARYTTAFTPPAALFPISTAGSASVSVRQLGAQGTGPVTVANLPTTPTPVKGDRNFVSDASSPTFGATVAGGGSTAMPVYYDGTNWKVG